MPVNRTFLSLVIGRREGYSRMMKPRNWALCASFLLFAAFSLFAKTIGTGTISVTSSVVGTEIFLDGISLGAAPVSQSAVPVGLHQVAAVRAGYRAERRIVTITESETTTVRFELAAASGTLEIRGLPPETPCEIEVAGIRASGNRIILPEGARTVRVRVFGYEDSTFIARITADRVTEVEAELTPVGFAVENLKVSRTAFNPENPAPYGSVKYLFSASAPGSGKITVLDDRGNAVRTIEVGPFAERRQAVDWDGRDDRGDPVPEGTYRARLDAVGRDGTKSRSGDATTRVDGKRPFPPEGGIFCPPESAALSSAGPRGTVSFGANARLSDGDFGSGMLANVGIAPNAEISCGADLGVIGGEPAIDATAAVKFSAVGGPVGRALVAGWTGRAVGTDELKDRAGLFFAPAAGGRLGAFGLGLSLPIAFGDAFGRFDDPYLTVGAAASIEAREGNLACAISGRIDSDRLDGPFAPAELWRIGVFSRYAIPRTFVTVAAGLGWKSAGGDGAPFAQGGFGVQF